MENKSIAAILEEAVDLLSTLDNESSRLKESQRLVDQWSRSHPNLQVALAIDRPPASMRVNYDLILTFPGIDTIALTRIKDDGVPWSVAYADHWAANYVVTINGEHITVPQVLRQLALIADGPSNLSHYIVNRVLEAQAILPCDGPVTISDVQDAADKLRLEMGLGRAADMMQFLEDHGISQTDFAATVASTLLAKRMRQRITDHEIESYFIENCQSFDRVRFCLVHSADQVLITEFVNLARAESFESVLAGFLRAGKRLNVIADERFARDIPGTIVSAAIKEVIGPLSIGRTSLAARIESRQAAALDADTITAVRSDLYSRWLSKARVEADIQWHWR